MGQCRTAPPSHRPGEKSLPPPALGAQTAAQPLRGTQAAAPPTPAYEALLCLKCRRGSEPVVRASMTSCKTLASKILLPCSVRMPTNPIRDSNLSLQVDDKPVID